MIASIFYSFLQLLLAILQGIEIIICTLLQKKLIVRALLDYVAAVKFLLTGYWGDFKAVLRARCEYRRLRSGYRSVREHNLAMTVAPVIKERATFSLLWQYYVKGKKYFSQLK